MYFFEALFLCCKSIDFSTDSGRWASGTRHFQEVGSVLGLTFPFSHTSRPISIPRIHILPVLFFWLFVFFFFFAMFTFSWSCISNKAVFCSSPFSTPISLLYLRLRF